MISFKMVLQVITLSLLTYSIFSLKGYLEDNFINKDTQIKEAVNNALNGVEPKSFKKD